MNRVLQRSSRREEALSDLQFTLCDLRASQQTTRKSYIVNRKWVRLLLGLLTPVFLLFLNISAFAEPRFPPPDFVETNHQLPVTTTPAARALWLQYLDVGILVGAMALATWFIYRKRSRRGLFWLSIFSLAYFGFYRKGCVCAIGSPQNIIFGLFNPGYTVPLVVTAFFVVPLAFALFAGRAFCSGVCPHGALQDLLLVRPIKVPAWLEHALGVIPFLFLGFGLAFAATGTGFPICRYDPIVPIFRLNGPSLLITFAVVTLIIGLFVGRPYCRFFCPYGALLKLASLASKWRVRVTPDICTQCQLCENSCPFGAMREPSPGKIEPKLLGVERRTFGWLVLLVPILIAGGAWLGREVSMPVSKLNPTVALAERYLVQQKTPVNYGVMTPETLSLQRAERDPEALLKSAADLRGRFKIACMLFGGWVGLVLGVKLASLSLRTRRTDFEPDRGACFACARCFRSCPNELVRVGLMPAGELPIPGAATVAAAVK